MERRVVITGLGVISPVGNNVTDFWKSLTEGRCGIDFIQGLDMGQLPIKVAGQVKNFNPEEYGIDRASVRKNDLYSQYALAAAHQAVTDSRSMSMPKPAVRRSMPRYAVMATTAMHTTTPHPAREA